MRKLKTKLKLKKCQHCGIEYAGEVCPNCIDYQMTYTQIKTKFKNKEKK